MALVLKLVIEGTVLLYQQDTTCTVTLSNSGPGLVKLMLPKMDPTMPIVRVVNVQTGAEERHHRSRKGVKVRDEPLELPAKDSLEAEFSLWEIVPELAPGEYEISVIWEYNNGEATAESNGVRIKVLPSTPKNLYRVNAVGGRSGVSFGVWVDVASDPPRIFRGSFSLMNGGGLDEISTVCNAKVTSSPVLSAPAGRTPLQSHWIAWKDGSTLNYTHVDDEMGVLRSKETPLPEGEVEIVAPLYSDQVRDATERPDGGVLLCQSAPGGATFQLQTIVLTPKRARSLGVASLPGTRPRWMTSLFRSSEERWITYLQVDASRISLSMAPWPGEKDKKYPGPTHLTDWTGGFLAAHATLDGENTIHGGILIWKAMEDESRKLVLIPWAVSSTNAFALREEHVIDWEPAVSIREARIAVSDNGIPAALLCDEEENWHTYDGKGKVLPAPPAFQKSKQPLELGFLNGGGEPLLICGTVLMGFKIIRFDGSPLPPSRTK